MGARIVISCHEEPPSTGEPSLFVDQRSLQERFQDGAILSSRLAHSFDNVLTGILGFAELTAQMATPGSVIAQYLAEVLRAAQQGVLLTQQLHQFGRASTASEGPALLAMVVADEEARFRSLLPPTVEFRVAIPESFESLAIGMEPLRQVLLHLLENSREATSSGTISLTARPAPRSTSELNAWLAALGPGPFAEIAIADTGSGLSPEVRRRLASEPFVTTKARHAGLGLATVTRILRAHGGGFRLGSGGGTGTQVQIYLPFALSTSDLSPLST